MDPAGNLDRFGDRDAYPQILKVVIVSVGRAGRDTIT